MKETRIINSFSARPNESFSVRTWPIVRPNLHMQVSSNTMLPRNHPGNVQMKLALKLHSTLSIDDINLNAIVRSRNKSHIYVIK